MRPGRVEVYRRRHSWGGKCWRWRQTAANGRIVSQSSEGYDRLRDLARSLELAFPGYRLLDQNGCLNGPEWWLWGLEPAWAGLPRPLPVHVTLGVGMRGVRIPVTVPAGVWLGSRR